MNRFAFELSSYTLKTFSGFSNANIKINGERNIPDGSVIFTANHFTRIETIFLPYHIYQLTGKQVWSLAAAELFEIQMLQGFLKNLGAVSTRDPNRDHLILQTLLTKDVQWIIFPEGMMVKNKKLIKQDQFSLIENQSVSRPHKGAAILALRCEFYRERLRRLWQMAEPEYDRLAQKLEIQNIQKILDRQTFIVPVNITYYPASPKENIVSRIGKILMKEPSQRVMDELMTEGSMLFSNVDIDIRFGEPIPIKPYLSDSYIESMLTVKRRVNFEEDVSSKQIIKEISMGIMEKYMTAVYDMTTLNYDHILACILKHFPYRAEGIDLYEFKCKAYYAIQWLLSQKKHYVSNTFYENQIHLLTDDRYHRISDFLTIAENTHVIEIRGNKMFKNQARFFINSDFNTIRIDNPVFVIANEVEPVREVETQLKKIAQESYDQIIALVKNKLIEKSQVEFSNDYNRYYIEFESKKKRIGTPVFLKHDHELAGILLIHGYMAAPEEMKPFAKYLHSKGYTVHVPRLRGHGTAPEDLAQTRYEQWIESVEEALVVLKHSCKKIIIGGFSTGAGLALDLATRVDGISAIFAVAPPMRLQDFGSYFVPAIDAWNMMIKKIHLSPIAKEFIDNQPENPHINYVRNPISGIHQLEKLMEQLEPKLSTIKTPTLVVQSRKDPVVNPKGTFDLFKKLGSEPKEYYIFDVDRHGILLGDNIDRIYNAIDNFIRQWV
ncbi:MAG: alpha/beta fold hydrolase [Pseudomonadota bacterium]